MENAASKCIRVCESIQKETDTQPEEVNFCLFDCGSFLRWTRWVWRIRCMKFATIHVTHNDSWTVYSTVTTKMNKALRISIGKNRICKSFYFSLAFLALLLLWLSSEFVSCPDASDELASIEMNRSPTITNTVPHHHSGVVRSPKTIPPIAAYARAIQWEIQC